MRRFLLCCVLSLGIISGIAYVNAGSMLLSPTNGALGMHCIYPIHFYVNVENASTKAMDMRIIYSGDDVQFTGDGLGMLPFGNYIPPRMGSTTKDIHLGWNDYLPGSKYQLLNWNSLITPLTGNINQLYYQRYFQTISNVSSAYLDFYYSGMWNGDDSNIQSGVLDANGKVINFTDALSSVNSGYYTFSARPCILDKDAPLFADYNSGLVVNYQSGLGFTIYDFTGEHIVTTGYLELSSGLFNAYSTTGLYRYNNTVHYRWTGGNYVPAAATSTGIDNQYGVNSGTISVHLSGLFFTGGAFTGETGGLYSPGSLVFTSFMLSSFTNSGLFSCSPMSTSVDKGYGQTWNGGTRGYSCAFSPLGLVSITGLHLDANQTIFVSITGADNINFDGTNNTGSVSYSLTVSGIDNVHPYIVSSMYSWTGVAGLTTTSAGSSFSLVDKANWLNWSKDPVVLTLTGNEIIVMDQVAGLTGNALTGMILNGVGYSGQVQSILFTGNTSGTLLFEDIATLGRSVNTGETYLTGGYKYVTPFSLDIFWIDTFTTQTTGYFQYGVNSATLNLSGYATGYAGSEKDDEFVITSFSGLTQPNVTYASGYSTGTYALYHSGIIFHDDWSGCVMYSDRGGNVGSYCFDLTGVAAIQAYGVYAIPDQRQDLSAIGLSNSGMIAKFTVISGFQVVTGMKEWNGTIVYSSMIKLSSTGYAPIIASFVTGTYTVILEGQSHLSQVLMGYNVPGSGSFDFRPLGNAYPGDMAIFDTVPYLTTGAQKDGAITTADLSNLISWIQIGSNVYSGGFYVYTGGAGKVELTGDAKLALVGYHPASLHAASQIQSQDINIINVVFTNPVPASFVSKPQSDPNRTKFFIDENLDQ